MSKHRIAPYINFQGRAREAMEFYQKALGGTIRLQALDDKSIARPAGPGDRVAYAQLEADGAFITGSDGHPKFAPTVGDNMAVALSGTDKDRVTSMFNALAEGGKVKGRITPQPWGGSAGYLLDKFGINWVVTIEEA